MKNADEYGLSAKDVTFDASKVVGRSRGVSSQLNGGVGYLLKKNKVDVIWGEASITKPGQVKVSKPSKPAVEPQNPGSKRNKRRGHLFNWSYHSCYRCKTTRAAWH